MDSIYLGLTIFLLVIALFDLSVGVSNDAVNFLSSAVGAKVAKMRTIITIAAIGILIGASTGSGMMDIARHGIFRPEMFSYASLAVIFVSVMVSDILLLNIFNNLGMPTSTTVSMVFELLGGTAALAMVKIFNDPSLNLSDLMNTEKALTVIMAIFVSVAIALFFGTVIQYICRLIFTFIYKDASKWKIGIFSGIAATSILYFMIIKGLGNSSLSTPEMMAWIDSNTLMLMAGCFVLCTIISIILQLFKVDVFKVLVLLGTFALAMAFAGNDLVNFIGVPLAALSSYMDFHASGEAAGEHMMGILNTSEGAHPIYLVIAGIVMAIALATSKKAHNVLKTSVGLSSQNEGDEMFGSSKVARKIVRSASSCSAWFSDLLSDKTKAWIETRFDRSNVRNENGAAFDTLRATVSLVTASLLIALGTHWQLPLSTTYVTFMVAMGSSLADRAWGRESAVFRITGVISVIGGWFITAGIAFVMSFFITLVIHFGGFPIMLAIIVLAVFILIKSNVMFKKKSDEGKDEIYAKMVSSTDKAETFALLSEHISKSEKEFLSGICDAYSGVTNGFMKENLQLIEKSEMTLRALRVNLKNNRRKEMNGMRLVDDNIAMEKNTWFHSGINSCEDILFCAKRITDACKEHTDNGFVPLDVMRIKEFTPLRDTVLFLLRRTGDLIIQGTDTERNSIRNDYQVIEECLDKTISEQLSRMRNSTENITVSYVYLNMLQESKEMIISLKHLIRASRHLSTESEVIQAPAQEIPETL